MEETKWLTKTKLIIIIALLLVIVGIITGFFIHRSNLKKEYIKFESQLRDGAKNYLLREKITLEENEWRKIEINDILKKNFASNPHASDCTGYVIVKASSMDESTGKIENTYSPYIKCKNIYTTENYGEKLSKETENTDKTQTEEDTIKPEITLFGDAEMTLTVGDKYIENGALASDNVDGNITKKIKITGKVDTNVAGTYEIKYEVSDKAKNKATIKRIVIVKEKEKEETPKEEVSTPSPTPTPTPTPTPSPAPTPTPVADTIKPAIVFNDNSLYQTICTGNSVNISVNGPYGYFASDNVDGNITNRVVISGNTGIIYNPGTYSVNYRVSDRAGNVTYATKNFTVKDCSVTIPKPNTEIAVQGVSLTPNNRTLSVGGGFQLTLTINPSNATNKSVTYSSSNSSVATVTSSGYVNAVSRGTATIMVTTSNGKRAICNITVN